MRLHPEFSWLIVPFSVMLDDFNFKWPFPKLPAISNNHTLMKMWGEMNADTRSLPVWFVKYIRVRRGASALTCNVDLIGRRALSGKHV